MGPRRKGGVMRRLAGMALALAATLAVSAILAMGAVAGFPWPELIRH